MCPERSVTYVSGRSNSTENAGRSRSTRLGAGRFGAGPLLIRDPAHDPDLAVGDLDTPCQGAEVLAATAAAAHPDALAAVAAKPPTMARGVAREKR